MKKAVHIVGIVYRVLLIVAIALMLLAGVIVLIAFRDEKLIQDLADSMKITTSSARNLVTVYIVLLFLIPIVSFVPAIIFNEIILKSVTTGTELTKKAGITFGVLAIVFGAEATGVLEIIHVCLRDKRKKEQTVID